MLCSAEDGEEEAEKKMVKWRRETQNQNEINKIEKNWIFVRLVQHIQVKRSALPQQLMPLWKRIPISASSSEVESESESESEKVLHFVCLSVIQFFLLLYITSPAPLMHEYSEIEIILSHFDFAICFEFLVLHCSSTSTAAVQSGSMDRKHEDCV